MKFFKRKQQQVTEEFDEKGLIPQHIAFIMDGNGRWAQKRMLPRIAGHKEGMETVRNIAIAADDLGVKAVTMYAFSTENWKRPNEEVNFLMKLPEDFFNRFMPEIHQRNMKIQLIGLIDELPTSTKNAVLRAVEDTKDHTGMILTFAMNYGSQAEILQATKTIAQLVEKEKITIDQIDQALFESCLQTGFLNELAAPDLMIRTSGEIRLSNFLCWQLAYSEFYFTDVLWPDFTRTHLLQAIAEYQKRSRRYGGV